MKNNSKLRKTKRSFLWIFAVFIFFMAGIFGINSLSAARAAKASTAGLRLVFTTDLHGQVVTYDYQSGKKYNNGSLSKAYTLIEDARNEAGRENTLTFDLGDCLYDYTSEYIYQNDEEAVQPIYKAMAEVGYDAVTIGNHDLDYGLSYLKNQLEKSGLSKVMVSSNIKNVITKKSEWNEVKIIKRELKTSDGRTVSVNIGVIGVVVPHLSTKTEDYTGVLEAEDIVQNVTKESAMLKENGADLVVVLSHSGMGEEEPEELAKNASYALTKIEDVDVVLCGHEHNAFPLPETETETSTAAKAYYSLPGVDKKTGLVNGKVLMMSKARGNSIGVADLKLSITADGSISIKDAAPKVRFVSSSTKVSEELDWNSIMGKWDDILRKAVKEDDVIASIAPDESLNNYFGIIKDNNAIQLLNDAKTAFGLSYVSSKNPEYLDKYPVIAASTFLSYGEIDGDDYISFNDEIKESDLTDFVEYRKRIKIYKITGARLREWIEWSASAYESPSAKTTKTSDGVYKRLLADGSLNGAVRPEWVNNWSSVYFFDGVEYTIDPSREPRYDKAGQKISDGNRVISLTRNGIPVGDEDEFLLVTDRISQERDATKGIELVYNADLRTVQNVLRDYLLKISKTGDLSVKPDYNWRVLYPEGKEYLVKSGIKSNMEAVKNQWSRIAFNSSYAYYRADLGTQQAQQERLDNLGPNLVVASANSEATNQEIKILVQANDVNNVIDILYLKGEYDAFSSIWNSPNTPSAVNGFSVSENGIYTVCAKDILGNRTAVKIYVSNINQGILQKPILKKYNNKSKTLRGTAEPGASLMVEADGEIYETQVKEDGSFKIKLPYQNSDERIHVWITDSFGRESERESVKVRRKGPNRPYIQNITNYDESIAGETKDKNVHVLAIAGESKVYLGNDEAEELWKKSSLYNKNIKVVKTNVKIKENGRFSMKIPILNADTAVKVYNIDAIGRVSVVRKTEVETEGPNQPVLYDVTDAEHLIYGKVPYCDAYKDAEYDVRVEVGNLEYEGVSNADGTFAVDVGLPPEEGEYISAYAIIRDKKGNELYSASRETKALSADLFIKEDNPALSLDGINDKESLVTGYYDISDCELYVSVGRRSFYDTASDRDGNINLELDDNPKADMKIYAVSRYDTGEMIEVAKTVVEKGLAEKPEIIQDIIGNSMVKIKASTDEECRMMVKIGNKTYFSDKCEEDEILGEFDYTIKIGRQRPGTEIVVWARNSAGDSKKTKVKVVETAPDIPEIDAFNEDSKVITGKVHIIADPEDEDMAEDAKSTGTKVWFMINGKKAEAKVNSSGSFRLKIKKPLSLKAGEKIYFWGENDYGGTGMRGSIKVEKGKKEKEEE